MPGLKAAQQLDFTNTELKQSNNLFLTKLFLFLLVKIIKYLHKQNAKQQVDIVQMTVESNLIQKCSLNLKMFLNAPKLYS